MKKLDHLRMSSKNVCVLYRKKQCGCLGGEDVVVGIQSGFKASKRKKLREREKEARCRSSRQ